MWYALGIVCTIGLAVIVAGAIITFLQRRGD